MIRTEDVLRALERLPWRDRDEIVGAAPLLVLAPHPDDESLGCGGLIAESCARGRDVHVAILTDGTGSHPSSPSYPAPRLRALRQREALAAVEALGLGALLLWILDGDLGFERQLAGDDETLEEVDEAHPVTSPVARAGPLARD